MHYEPSDQPSIETSDHVPRFNPMESLNTFNVFLLVEDESVRQLARLYKEREALLARQSVMNADICKYERLLSVVRS